jgi:hypothetical protein
VERNTLQTKHTNSVATQVSPSGAPARTDRWRAGASGTDAVRELCCYDDDMADPSSSSTVAAGYLSLSPLFIYLFLFLPVLQYACLDVLQSSFKYAYLECVTFKLSIYVYVIFMSNNFWIKIMRKLSRFLTILNAPAQHVNEACSL